MRKSVLVAVAFALLPVPALADPDVPDPYASALIQRGDYARAERVLVAQRGSRAVRPEVQLNLATVYARTGRIDAARALYQAVLEQPEVALALDSERSFGSHQLARAALTNLAR